MDIQHKIEAYFSNQLNATEKENFLQEVASNAALKKEFDFQQELINGIKQARKAELKAMLNNVPVASVGSATTGLVKVLVGGATTLLMGTVAWYYFNSTPEGALESVSQTHSTEQQVAIKSKEATPLKQKAILENKEEKNAIETKSSNATNEATPKVITPQLPQASDVVVEENNLNIKELDVPKTSNSNSINLNSKVNVEVKLRKKYNFHYQYQGSKLLLYGEFKEGLFEILEVNNEDGNQLYLYFKHNFYNLDNHSGSIIALEPIQNQALITKLSSLRK